MPANVMELPGCYITDQVLELDTFDQDRVVLYTKLFVDILESGVAIVVEL